jgi:NDP-sugar pyrophosphorylase family protein
MPSNRMSLRGSGLAALVMVAALSACGMEGVNGPVNIPPGATAENASTVNGSVNVGDGARIKEAVTVNGGVNIGNDVTAESATTVNGGVRIGSNTKIARDVVTVNGGIQLSKGADVSGNVTNVNGGIQLDSAHVRGTITTVQGDIEVGAGSRVEGGIHVDRPEFSTDDKKKNVPRIVIGPGATVDGPMRFEREVKLYVSDTAKIGAVEGATPEMFSGDTAPGESNLPEPEKE